MNLITFLATLLLGFVVVLTSPTSSRAESANNDDINLQKDNDRIRAAAQATGTLKEFNADAVVQGSGCAACLKWAEDHPGYGGEVLINPPEAGEKNQDPRTKPAVK